MAASHLFGERLRDACRRIYSWDDADDRALVGDKSQESSLANLPD